MEKDRLIRQIRAAAHKFDTRDDGGSKRIEGYFAVFDDVYEIWPGATESVDRHAFDETIGDDIRCLIDHETRLVLGRTGANTLTFRIDDHGLWGSVELNPADTDAMNLYARVQRGDVNQCSFGFDILDESVNYREDGSIHWTIKKVKLYEVSCVTFPAYESTSIDARKADYAAIQKRELDAWKAKIERKMKKCSDS